MVVLDIMVDKDIVPEDCDPPPKLDNDVPMLGPNPGNEAAGDTAAGAEAPLAVVYRNEPHHHCHII